MKTYIDLRSDTVTQPCAEMRKAMAGAIVGDDVYGEDPTVNHLQQMVADMAGKEAGLFVPSGTQGNLLAILSHCQRGDEYIAGQHAHCYRYEAGGAAVLGGVQPQPLDFMPDGTLNLAQVEALVKPDNDHFAITRLLCLENTQSGKTLPMDYQAAAARFARDKHLRLHLDGARVFNATVSLKMSLADIAQFYDTISVCLSKGLGAPAGSVLVGSEEIITRARRWRKMAGGGMRQAGILAAAGIYALEHNIDRLATDHEHAHILAEGLEAIDELSIDLNAVHTNMVFIDCPSDLRHGLIAYLKDRGILVGGYGCLRLVTHLGINRKDIDLTVNIFKEFFAENK